MRALLFVACLFAPSLALAQASVPGTPEGVPCMNSAAFSELLLSQYGERPVVEGADGSGMPIRWFANPDSGTWTMAIYPQPDLACQAADGKSFRPARLVVGEISH